MSNISVTMAICDYDHVRDLTTGRVKPQGIDIIPLDLPVEEIFYRFTRYREWAVSELSLCKYTAMRSRGDTSLVAIPVFPSRVFRQSSIYIRPGGPESPSDLAGARVGIPEWAQTASVYSRGFLAHEYGVGLGKVDWVQAGVNDPGRVEKVDLSLPAEVRLTRVPDQSLNDMLIDGQLDAVLSARAPRGSLDGSGKIVRMLPNYREIEREYAQRTGIFPIMHVIVLREDLYKAHPWAAMNLLTAFEQAKVNCLERLRDITASRSPLPWVAGLIEESAWLFGEHDYWPYGLEGSRVTLEAFLGFAHEQGVIDRAMEPEELFAKETLSRYRV